MNRISIKLRVTLWYTLILLVISGVALFAMITVSHNMLIRDSSERLIGNVNNLARNLAATSRDFRRMPGFHFFERGVHTALYDEAGNLIGGVMPFEFVGDIPFADDQLLPKEHDGENFLTYVKKAAAPDGSSVWIKGVISVADESRMLESVSKTNVMLTAILILAAGGGGYLIMRGALRPVDKIGQTAKEISRSNDLSQRIGLGSGKDEIYRLAATFDEMLDKIETTLEKEKQFTSDASHELRTPVAVITSECEYVLDCAKSLEEARESVSAIKRQSDKMSKLISDLLTISRMDKNTLPMHFETVDVSELLGFICDEQEEIHDGSITLIRSMENNLCVRADHFLLARMFINLIANAYAYGKKNGTITVSLRTDGGSMVAAIADDGIGIEKEHLPKIWERFYQVDTARTSSENSSAGLGLSMVKWIAEQHGGNIAVESEPGKGTCFTFTMPKC